MGGKSVDASAEIWLQLRPFKLSAIYFGLTDDDYFDVDFVAGLNFVKRRLIIRCRFDVVLGILYHAKGEPVSVYDCLK